MTFSTPRKLSSLAAKAFIEDLILESQLFSVYHFKHFEKGTFLTNGLDLKCVKEKLKFDFDIPEIKGKMMLIMELMDEILRGCSPKTIESILEVLRATDHHCSAGAVMLQFLYDTEVNFRKRHWILFPILEAIEQTFPSVEKIVFDTLGEKRSIRFLGKFVRFLPNLKSFKGMVTKETKFMSSLRVNCPKLIDLTIIVKDGFFTSDQLTSFFFNGKSLDSVKKAYVKLECAPLSFPKLETFNMGGVGYEQYDFFKMFLHFYNKVSFCVGLHYSHLYSNSVSWFDAVLSHSVVINPNLGMSQCELNIHDLYLPFFERSIANWNNLESLLISLGIQGKKTPATSTNIGKRLEYLLSKREKVKDLYIRMQGPINDDEVSEILVPSLRAHGTRLRQLKVFGLFHFLSHRSLVQILNLCPNLKHIAFVGKRIMKYFKDVKLKPLLQLESLTVLWSEVQTNTTFCQWISKFSSDLIKNAPKLKTLYCTANIHLMDHLTRIKFGSELEKLVIHFHTEVSCEGVLHLKRMLPRLPKLEKLVVKESYSIKSCDCDDEYVCLCNEVSDSIYGVVKRFVDNTEIYLRYHSFDDSQIELYF